MLFLNDSEFRTFIYVFNLLSVYRNANISQINKNEINKKLPNRKFPKFS